MWWWTAIALAAPSPARPAPDSPSVLSVELAASPNEGAVRAQSQLGLVWSTDTLLWSAELPLLLHGPTDDVTLGLGNLQSTLAVPLKTRLRQHAGMSFIVPLGAPSYLKGPQPDQTLPAFAASGSWAAVVGSRWQLRTFARAGIRWDVRSGHLERLHADLLTEVGGAFQDDRWGLWLGVTAQPFEPTPVSVQARLTAWRNERVDLGLTVDAGWLPGGDGFDVPLLVGAFLTTRLDAFSSPDGPPPPPVRTASKPTPGRSLSALHAPRPPATAPSGQTVRWGRCEVHEDRLLAHNSDTSRPPTAPPDAGTRSDALEDEPSPPRNGDTARESRPPGSPTASSCPIVPAASD